MKKTTLLAALLAAALPALAGVDIVTLPTRDGVEVTIYNSADLTLVRDTRTLTMKKGTNRLQYSWAGTLIDPTSLELLPKGQAGGITIRSVEYPPRVTGMGVWNLESAGAGKVPFEITAFTSGLGWRAYYVAMLNGDESAVDLEGFVRVDNNSGEDYENAATRLVVGRINLLDRIADLARRQYPFDRPGGPRPIRPMPAAARGDMAERDEMLMAKSAVMEMKAREIIKEGLSEYFLYTIEGTEDLANGWGKRLVSFAAPQVPVANLYRYDEETYGPSAVRFLSFANDEKHKLGREPIPEGAVMVFKASGQDGGLTFVGSRSVKYIPKGGEVDLNLGINPLLTVRPVLMDFETLNYEWKDDQITGWDEKKTWKVEIANNQAAPAKVEIRRNTGGTNWEIENEGNHGRYAPVDAHTISYLVEMKPFETRAFTYKTTVKTGSRAM